MSGGALASRMAVAAPRHWAARLGGIRRAVAAAPIWQARTWRRRCQALEHTLDELSDRLARAEIALLREQRGSQQAAQRAAEAETALVRVQATLDRLRQQQGQAAEFLRP